MSTARDADGNPVYFWTLTVPDEPRQPAQASPFRLPGSHRLAAEVAALQQAMDPSSLVPDVTLAVAADGSVGVDFDLPRFAISLITVRPAAGTNEAGVTGGGCSCEVGGHSGDAANPALFAIGALALVKAGLRRSCARRPAKASRLRS
jgi:hypothetical protein